MLEYQHGEIGWEVYTLEYKIDAPVNVVLDEDSMNAYTKLFTHLWKIKRCEFSLNESWRKVTNGARWWKKVAGERALFLTFMHFWKCSTC
jgi:gamma-tubulin complex component 3